MVGGGRVNRERADALVHTAVDAAAARLGLCDTRPLRGRFVVLIDGGEGGVGLRGVKVRGWLGAGGGRRRRLIMSEGRAVDSRMSAIRRGLRRGNEAKGGIVVAGAIGGRRVGGGSYRVSTAPLPLRAG